MSTGAVVMMAVSIVIIWGGLAVSAVWLRRHPDPEDAPRA
ncbi:MULTISPECIES: methionine/alanine import family NSS transporter small subunit [Nocardiopsis]|nr:MULTISPECIES: methionine/alanine import family NSS transporter small subunit [Nocardiopsis]